MKLQILLFFICICTVFADDGENNNFQVAIAPGVNECFYQSVPHGYYFYSTFKVIQGVSVNYYIQDSTGHEVYRVDSDTYGAFVIEDVTVEGDYMVCIDNSGSLLSHVIASLYITTYNITKLQVAHEESTNVSLSAHAILNSTNAIVEHMNKVAMDQVATKFKQTYFVHKAQSINEMVMNWSIVHTVLIILCGNFQVYFIKRLFTRKNTSRFKY